MIYKVLENTFVKSRQDIADSLNNGLSTLEGLTTPKLMDGNTHAYYIYGMKIDTEFLGVKRENIIKALEAEGLTGLANGYANIHLLPLFQKKIAYGKNGFPWTSNICSNQISYKKGICPIAEKLHDETFIGFEMCLHKLTKKEVDLIIKSFKKVWENLKDLS